MCHTGGGNVMEIVVQLTSISAKQSLSATLS